MIDVEKMVERRKVRILELEALIKAAGATRVRIVRDRGWIRAFAKTPTGIRVCRGDSIEEALLGLLHELTTTKGNEQ